MKRSLPLFFGLLLFLSLTLQASAQIKPPYGGGLNIEVSASVGQYYLSLSGYSSPFASISLYSDGLFIRGTAADQNGNFSISEVLIKDGFSNFCLVTKDAKGLGSSETCFNVPSAHASINKNDIFLPPTLALSKSEISEGETTIAYGYTMPNVNVTLYLSDGTKYKLKADKNGYFRIELRGLKAGKYAIYATAKYKNLESSSPAKKLTVHVLNWWEQFLKFLKDLWDKFVKLFTSWSLGPLWLVIPIIILIIILIIKLWKDRLTSLMGRIIRFLFLLIPHKKKLHHWWWMGY